MLGCATSQVKSFSVRRSIDYGGFMATRSADLARVVPPTTALPEQRQACVLGACQVGGGNAVPAPTVRAVQLVTGMKRRIVAGKSCARILRSSRIVRDSGGPGMAVGRRAAGDRVSAFTPFYWAGCSSFRRTGHSRLHAVHCPFQQHALAANRR